MQKVFKKYLDPNHSIASIVTLMDNMGIRTRHGRPYAKSHVQRILNNPFYIGINRFDGKDYQGAQEPIISKELFDAVQQKMHKGRPVVFAKHNPIFKGLIRCEDCGTTVTWQLQKGHYYGVCKRLKPDCKLGKMLREDKIEESIVMMLRQLVCPSQNIIDWVASKMRDQNARSIEEREKLIASIQTQIDRIDRMDEGLYDDKLAGEINQVKYKEKHEQFVVQKTELNTRLNRVGASTGRGIEHKLVILELSQKAADLYPKKSPEQKRLIMSKLFSKVTTKAGALSVEYTNFTKAIAENVLKTNNLMEAKK
jgi:hypothetical protein